MSGAEIGPVPSAGGAAGEGEPVTVTFSGENGDVTVNVNVEQTCNLDTGGSQDEEGEDDEEEEEPETEEGDIEPGPPALPILARVFDQDLDKTCVEMKRLFEVLKGLDDGGVGTLKAILTATTPEQFEEWWASQKTFGPDWFAPLKRVFGAVLFLGQTANGMASILFGQQCDKDPGPYVVRWIVSFLQRWLGDGVKDTITSLDYIIRHNCPILVPSTAEANRLYFLGEISAEIWECWVKMNGDKPDIQTRVVQSMRAKASASDLITLFMRKKIDIEQLRNQGRFAGLRDNFDIGQFVQLREHWPAIDTIIRFMTRDVFDDRVVKKYNLFGEFTEKYTDKAELLGEAQGFTKDMARLYWAAHWKLPSPTQAYEMMFRLRPGRVAKEVEVTPEDVKDLLGVADYPDHWRDRLSAISYRKLRILDVRRAYYHGQIDQSELTERGMDIGYTRKDAEAWARLQQEERLEWWTKQRWGKAYLQGYISEDLLRSKMEVKGMPIKDRESIVSYLKEILETERRKACVESLKDRVLIGDVNAVTAGNLLVAYGLDVYQAEQIVLGWECERGAKLKYEGASKLAKWAVDGLLTIEELTRRLIVVGYVPDDIARIVSEVQIKQADNARKARERLRAERERRAERRRRERERQLRQAQTLAERAEREREKAKRLKERIAVRERQCMEVWSELAGIPESQARALFRAEVDRFRKVKGLAKLSSLDLVCGVLKDAKRRKVTDPTGMLDEAFAALPNATEDRPDPARPGAREATLTPQHR